MPRRICHADTKLLSTMPLCSIPNTSSGECLYSPKARGIARFLRLLLPTLSPMVDAGPSHARDCFVGPWISTQRADDPGVSDDVVCNAAGVPDLLTTLKQVQPCGNSGIRPLHPDLR
jgi:hypothetical protein